MAGVTEPKLPPWILKLGPRRTGILVAAVFVITGVGLLVGAIVRAHGTSTFAAIGISFLLGAAAVPLLLRQKRWSGSMSNWVFGATVGAAPFLGSLLPGPAIVSLLAMGAGFLLAFAPVYLRLQRAHMDEIEERWARWQD